MYLVSPLEEEEDVEEAEPVAAATTAGVVDEAVATEVEEVVATFWAAELLATLVGAAGPPEEVTALDV